MITLDEFRQMKDLLHATVLEEKLGRSRIPAWMHGGIVRYVTEGIQPGDFLTSVLRNDLKNAVAHADDDNRRLIPDYVQFFYNNIPGVCWGSPEKVLHWMQLGILNRHANVADPRD